MNQLNKVSLKFMSSNNSNITIMEILSEAKISLYDAGVSSYSIDAELILANVLECSREKIIGYPKSIISTSEAKLFRENLKRRLSKEPLSHIIEKREFWGLDFYVNSSVLDPRPDSETLIEAVLNYYQDRKSEQLNILDLGVGSGCLLITLLYEFKNAVGVGVDKSIDAIEVAKKNSLLVGVGDRTKFVESDWCKNVEGEFDIIISNPPYIKSSDIPDLQDEVKNHEPLSALDGGKEGVDCYKLIASSVSKFLRKGGVVIMEFGIGQDKDVKQILLENSDLKFISFFQDLSLRNRCIMLTR